MITYHLWNAIWCRWDTVTTSIAAWKATPHINGMRGPCHGASDGPLCPPTPVDGTDGAPLGEVITYWPDQLPPVTKRMLSRALDHGPGDARGAKLPEPDSAAVLLLALAVMVCVRMVRKWKIVDTQNG